MGDHDKPITLRHKHRELRERSAALWALGLACALMALAGIVALVAHWPLGP